MGVQTMLLYLSFPVTMFWVSNQAAYFEEHVVQRKVGARTPGPPRGTRGHVLTPSRHPDTIAVAIAVTKGTRGRGPTPWTRPDAIAAAVSVTTGTRGHNGDGGDMWWPDTIMVA
uniref:Uncharacterized protein n=1 Tax=Apteryx owenii TaxID=8824 RepID=A0A8B9NZ39_APTOW